MSGTCRLGATLAADGWRPFAHMGHPDRQRTFDKSACADAGSKVPNPRRTSRRRACFFDPIAFAQMRAFSGMRRLSSRQTSDEALEPQPVNRKSNPSSPFGESKGTPMRPAVLPGSRISEIRETTDGSAELKFRIQFPPAGRCYGSAMMFRHNDGIGPAWRA